LTPLFIGGKGDTLGMIFEDAGIDKAADREGLE
jgi:hypothetical protein